MRTEFQTRARDRWRPCIWGALLVGLIGACSAGSDISVFGPTGGAKPSGAGGQAEANGGGNAAGDTGSTSPLGTGGEARQLTVENRGGAMDGSAPTTIEPDAACAKDTQQATILPVNMFIQFDRSSSMSQKAVGATDTKWAQASAGLDAFFRDPGSAGLGIALHFFPSDRPACGCQGSFTGTGGECNAEACGVPLVALGELTAESDDEDPQEGALVAAVGESTPPAASTGFNPGASTPECTPDGEDRAIGTPLGAALDGAIRWAVSNQETSTDAKWVVVLVTDGEPHGCGTAEQIVQLAKDANTKNVLVYAIGMEGADTALMNRVAAAGGTSKAFNVAGAGGQQQLLDALNAIRGNAISCDITIQDSKEVDENKVNVTFTPSDGSEAVHFGKVPNVSVCGDDGGWFFADSTHMKVTLCPTSCALAQADSKGRLDVLFGCQSYTTVPQ